ncbi:hypothetical protein, partial [Spirillospora sp. NPDC029432]|uniref:hypothetical protein n=1 Tax=Spirillospora sp. NPDC029432 TaxID=3154599 RepID=UPI00345399CD
MDTDPGSGRGGPGGRRGDGRPIVPPAQNARQSGALGARETSGVHRELAGLPADRARDRVTTAGLDEWAAANLVS